MSQIQNRLRNLAVLYMCSYFGLTRAVDREVQILWFAPKDISEDSEVTINASSSVGALAIALERIQEEELLPNIHFSLKWLDSRCDGKQSIGLLADFLAIKNVDVIFGPPCTESMTAVADLASYKDIPVFGWLSNDLVLDDKKRFSTLIRLSPSLTSFGHLLLMVCVNMRWYKLSLISSNTYATNTVARSIVYTIDDINEHRDVKFEVVKHYSRLNVNSSVENITKILQNIKISSRVVVLIIPQRLLRQYMLLVHENGMDKGDYQFIFIEQKIPDRNEFDFLNSSLLWQKHDHQDSAARQAFENLIYDSDNRLSEINPSIKANDSRDAQTNCLSTIAAYYPTSLTYVVDLNKRPAEEAIDATDRVFNPSDGMPKAVTADKYAPFLHDAVYLFALALNQSMPYGNATDGGVIIPTSRAITFDGMTGNVLINDNVDRAPSFVLWDLSKEGYFRIVSTLEYQRVGNSNVLKTQTHHPIIWGDGSTSDDRIPPDEPICGFKREKCAADDTVTYIIFGVLLLIMLASIFGFFIFYRWWKKEQNLRNMEWKVPYSELDFEICKRTKSTLNVDMSVGHLSMESLPSDTESEIGFRNRHRNILETNDSITLGPVYYTTVARYKENVVAVQEIRKPRLKVDRALLEDIQVLLRLKHNNMCNFIGVCTETNNVNIIWEYCNKGSLEDVLENNDMKLDPIFQYSIAVDICSGLDFLHGSSIKLHGNLKSNKCLIDSRWICKITDYGISRLKFGQSSDRNKTDIQKYESLFWTAPELLRLRLEGNRRSRTQEGDVYALGVILKEIVCRSTPYAEERDVAAKDIVYEVAKLDQPNPKRPLIDFHQPHHVKSHLISLIRSCWSEQPDQRPTAKRVLKTITRLNPYRKTNVMDNMLSMMEKYSNNLEELVTERTLQLEAEKKKTDALLYKMLPKPVADDLKCGNVVQAEAFESVTIYFSDIVGFTSIAAESSPLEIVDLLNSLYHLFDATIQLFDVYKVETIGDAYMVASGLPQRNGDKHVSEMCDMALTLLKVVISFRIPHKPETQLKLRIGLHTGPVVAGVVGSTMPRYCLFGDTVNTASRMESSGQALRVHISSPVAEKIRHDSSYFTKPRGMVDVKGKGKMKTFWLTGKLGIYQEVETLEFPAKSPVPEQTPRVPSPTETDTTDSITTVTTCL